jgi:hypothetical protein
MHENGEQNDYRQRDADQPKQEPTSESHNILLNFSSVIFNVEQQFLFRIPAASDFDADAFSTWRVGMSGERDRMDAISE